MTWKKETGVPSDTEVSVSLTQSKGDVDKSSDEGIDLQSFRELGNNTGQCNEAYFQKVYLKSHQIKKEDVESSQD
jgi:hypothetical protein